jgi:hypothetical protein
MKLVIISDDFSLFTQVAENKAIAGTTRDGPGDRAKEKPC